MKFSIFFKLNEYQKDNGISLIKLFGLMKLILSFQVLLVDTAESVVVKKNPYTTFESSWSYILSLHFI